MANLNLLVPHEKTELELYDKQANETMQALLQTPIARKLHLLELPKQFWLEEISKYLVPECKRALGAFTIPTALHALSGVPWTPDTTGLAAHISEGSNVGLVLHSSTSTTLGSVKEKWTSRLANEVSDDAFEPSSYAKHWSTSPFDHWATIAIIPFPHSLHPHELAFRILMSQIISTFVSFWIGVLPSTSDGVSRRAASNLCYRKYGVTPLSVSLDLSRVIVPETVRALMAAKAREIAYFIETNNTHRIDSVNLSRILRTE